MRQDTNQGLRLTREEDEAVRSLVFQTGLTVVGRAVRESLCKRSANDHHAKTVENNFISKHVMRFWNTCLTHCRCVALMGRLIQTPASLNISPAENIGTSRKFHRSKKLQ